jgi:hypothetical protein
VNTFVKLIQDEINKEIGEYRWTKT